MCSQGEGGGGVGCHFSLGSISSKRKPGRGRSFVSRKNSSICRTEGEGWDHLSLAIMILSVEHQGDRVN